MSKTKFINWDDVSTSFKNRTDWIGARVRNILVKNQLKNSPQPDSGGISFKDIRSSIKQNYDKAALRINENVTNISNKTNLLMEGSQGGKLLSKIWSKPWARKSIYGIGSLALFSLVQKSLGVSPEPAIPKKYERGYDVMDKTLTDFGSPINLLKTASKTITPYYSSVRKSIVTTTATVTNKNLALFLNKRAIGHTRY